jgi:hypothetical protein
MGYSCSSSGESIVNHFDTYLNIIIKALCHVFGRDFITKEMEASFHGRKCHNWVVEEGGDKFIIHEDEAMPSITHQSSSHGQAIDHAFMVNFRQEIVNFMWEDRQNYHGNM